MRKERTEGVTYHVLLQMPSDNEPDRTERLLPLRMGVSNPKGNRTGRPRTVHVILGPLRFQPIIVLKHMQAINKTAREKGS